MEEFDVFKFKAKEYKLPIFVKRHIPCENTIFAIRMITTYDKKWIKEVIMSNNQDNTYVLGETSFDNILFPQGFISTKEEYEFYKNKALESYEPK